MNMEKLKIKYKLHDELNQQEKESYRIGLKEKESSEDSTPFSILSILSTDRRRVVSNAWALVSYLAVNEIGFSETDCFYKYGIFAVYGGRK